MGVVLVVFFDIVVWRSFFEVVDEVCVFEEKEF